MADSQVKTANICNITSSTLLRPNAGGSGTYIADNSISAHMTNQHRASGIYISSLPEQSVIGDKYTISFVPVCATNNVMLVVLYGATTQISFTSGNRYTLTITATAADNTMAFYGGDTVEKTVIIKDIQIEKGENATPYRPYSATGWLHSLRKLTTATDTITTLPSDLYADGNTATVGLKGNMSQLGTPTPDNPIQPQECGERTGNLFDGRLQQGFYAYSNGVYTYGTNYVCTYLIPCEAETTYTFNLSRHNGSKNYGFVFFDENQSRIGADYSSEQTITDEVTYTATSPQNSAYLAINIAYATGEGGIDINSIKNFMLNSGSTVLPYEPYGYKIPISSANTTTPVYLGEVQTTRKIKKLVLTGNEEYSNDWRPATGTYAALIKISNTIPESDNVIPICTHLQGKHYDYLFSGEVGVSRVPSSVYCIAIRVPDTIAANQSELVSWLAAQYANGTPVTVYYVPETSQTGIVNEPLRKIGDYADTVSGISIPTITGKDTFDVQTTLKPSEVDLTYHGWHDATVKEWDGSDWQ